MLVLIRGLPGSGKTTEALKILKEFNIKHHYEADMYFTDENGNYNYDASKIKEAHEWCLMKTKQAIENGEDVVVSNTFTRKWEMEKYVQIAKENNTPFYILTATGNFKNIHGVPQETIEKMRQRFETVAESDF